MFSGIGRLDDPFFSHARRQWDVNSVNRGIVDQLLITAQCFGSLLEGDDSLALVNEFLAAAGIATRDGSNGTIAGQIDCFPILKTNFCGAQKTPTAFFYRHKQLQIENKGR